MTDEFFDDLQKLIDGEKALELQPGDITVTRLIKRSGWNKHHARRMLRDWVKGGRMVYLGRRRQASNGMMVEAWRVTEEKCTKV